MDSQYLQHLRFALQKRVRRLNSCEYQFFHSALVQFWNFVQAQPHFQGVLAKLDAEAQTYTEELDGLVKNSQGIPVFETEADARGFTFRLVQHCAKQPVGGHGMPEVGIGRAVSRASKHGEALDSFREAYLEPFYELLDESLDNQAAVLSLLLKYKRRVEWFERESVSTLASSGERALAKHLYGYLFDQGLSFHIEPQSASGEADLVAQELVLDAKVFDAGRRGTAYIRSGVHQLLTYARDFHQPVGYLVIYRTCPEDLQFSFERSDALVPFIQLAGRTLYLLVVDICEHEASASKRGTLRTCEIQESELRELVSDAVGSADGSHP